MLGPKKHRQEMSILKQRRKLLLGYINSPATRKKMEGNKNGCGKRSLESCKNISKALIGNKYAVRSNGERIDSCGYVRVYDGNSRGIRKHHLVIEQYFGRRPKYSEATHHVNEIKTDNRIQNLMLFKSYGAHTRFHKLGDAGVKTGDIVFDGRKV
jgi:hypothetical protein